WFHPAIVAGAGLGLRQAEVSGLTVDRVDWLRRTVRVDRQWRTKGPRDEWGFAPTKTAASTRTIPAAAAVLTEMGRHTGEVFVVELPTGGPADHNRFNAAWRATCKTAGIEGMRFHSLRHHFASALISAGCSVKAVQHALGHTSATTTLTTYSHLWPGDEDRIRAAVEVAFSPAEDSVRTDGAG
ncbi:MAG: site-specific integrase, partial [Iamia sp.]